MNPRIYLLAFGTFTVGTEGYVIAGILPEVAADVHASVALCGQLVTVFALVYALAGPPLIALFHRVPPKTLLVGAAIGFALSNVLAAVASNFAVLTVARVAAAVTAALFAAPAASAAAALSKPEDLPRAIAVTASGNALALTVGAPIGTVIGALVGWRGAFLFVAGLAVVSAVGVFLWLPTVPVPAASTGRLNLLRSAPIRWGLVTTFGLFLAAYCTYTYLAPIVGGCDSLGRPRFDGLTWTRLRLAGGVAAV
ncbi:Purine efflux pump PbuE OS=Tsukamurella paurometabola OX=2061 GN=pbuE_1 PE=4 SV=1 [Tsukamurella paurometabola]|uniref:MFS transporter n=1 Tax=Tsukamurella paurometabola TaxID=2061 RepID=UPI00019F03A5|nr:MFS transporter [Tsukamurella paurometabola]SUP36440.1 Purine efflux pump PbuE [Tsukamurella paurometabola]